jgi:DNA-directed RNA polymerase specialized sigma24 family protein
MASASRRRRGFSVVPALDREWGELDRRYPGAVSRWAERHDVLTSCRSFEDVLSAARRYSDPVLAALLTEVSLGDQLAGRVVLQAVIGRMVRMAQRDPRAGIDDYLAQLWCAISSYPLQRRPVRIAANLSMDTLKAVSREHRWIGRGEITLWPSSESLEELLSPAGLDGTRYDSLQPADVEARRVLEASSLLRLIDNSSATLLQSVYVDGMTGAQAARRLHISAGTVRVQCSKVVRELAAHAVELAEAAGLSDAA